MQSWQFHEPGTPFAYHFSMDIPAKYAGGVNKYIREQGRRDVLRVVYELFGLDAAAVCQTMVNREDRHKKFTHSAAATGKVMCG